MPNQRQFSCDPRSQRSIGRSEAESAETGGQNEDSACIFRAVDSLCVALVARRINLCVPTAAVLI